MKGQQKEQLDLCCYVPVSELGDNPVLHWSNDGDKIKDRIKDNSQIRDLLLTVWEWMGII